MEMTLRWYGTGFDTVTLKEIRQIPGVTGVITTLYDTKPVSYTHLDVYKRQIVGEGFKTLEEGQKVTFDTEQDPKNSKKLRAVNVVKC